MSRLPTRRTLLTGTAGLILGAGATQAGNALTDNHPASTALRPPSPGEELMTEHGLLKRVLLAYRAMIDQLDAGTTPPTGALTDAAQIIADYVESFHEGLEEAYVFPRVQAANADLADLVHTLLVQHDRGRHLTATILTTAASGLAATKARAALREDLTRFVRMYEPHEAWEDTVIYPTLRTHTPQPTLDQLAERFAELENKQYGDNALTQILGRIAGIEQQLGIDNLATFTPPSP